MAEQDGGQASQNMMTPWLLFQAEGAAGAWASRLIGLIAEAEILATQGNEFLTEANRRDGRLLAGYDQQGRPVEWTEAQMHAAQVVYSVPAQFVQALRASTGGRTLLQELQLIARSSPPPQNGPQG